MVNEIMPVIEWISNCIELERESQDQTLSLWSELYNFGQAGDLASQQLPDLPEGAAPVVVYVTGALDEIGQRKGPFYHLGEPDHLVYLIYGEEDKSIDNGSVYKRSDSLLQYLTICYVPNTRMKEYQDKISRFIVFTRGKLEIWMKSLLIKKKVAGFVGWEGNADPDWHVSWMVPYHDFSYSFFLKDDLADSRKPVKSVHPLLNPPSNLKLSLQRALKEGITELQEQLWIQTIDSAAKVMLEKYWLHNGTEIKYFVPQLTEKVIEYYKYIRSIPPNEKNVDRVDEFFHLWLKRRGHVNAH